MRPFGGGQVRNFSLRIHKFVRRAGLAAYPNRALASNKIRD